MKSNSCPVCGLPKGACLHQKQLKEYRSDLAVMRMLWFTLGFLAAAISVLIILIFVHEKYL
nr:hypothetical protein [uncultured Flavobacterium sp.]